MNDLYTLMQVGLIEPNYYYKLSLVYIYDPDYGDTEILDYKSIIYWFSLINYELDIKMHDVIMEDTNSEYYNDDVNEVDVVTTIIINTKYSIEELDKYLTSKYVKDKYYTPYNLISDCDYYELDYTTI